MTGDKLLQYLGLRRAPGTEHTTANRLWTWTMVVVVVVALFLTRNLDLGPQIAVMLGVAAVLGVMGGTLLTTIAARRARSTDA